MYMTCERLHFLTTGTHTHTQRDRHREGKRGGREKESETNEREREGKHERTNHYSADQDERSGCAERVPRKPRLVLALSEVKRQKAGVCVNDWCQDRSY